MRTNQAQRWNKRKKKKIFLEMNNKLQNVWWRMDVNENLTRDMEGMKINEWKWDEWIKRFKESET